MPPSTKQKKSYLAASRNAETSADAVRGKHKKKRVLSGLVLSKLDACESGKAKAGGCLVLQSAGEGWYGRWVEGVCR